jgi:MarR family transcriptional regulator, temperature-dependent positive regulator of motility
VKKVGLVLMVFLLSVVFAVKPAEAAYLSQYDYEVEVSAKEAQQLANLLGLKGIPLGPETAKLSFEMQEKLIAKIEKLLKTEIDHYYVWLTVDGVRVLAIDPPVPLW